MNKDRMRGFKDLMIEFQEVRPDYPAILFDTYVMYCLIYALEEQSRKSKVLKLFGD